MSVSCWILMSALAKLTLLGKESSVSGAAFSPPPTSPPSKRMCYAVNSSDCSAFAISSHLALVMTTRCTQASTCSQSSARMDCWLGRNLERLWSRLRCTAQRNESSRAQRGVGRGEERHAGSLNIPWAPCCGMSMVPTPHKTTGEHRLLSVCAGEGGNL